MARIVAVLAALVSAAVALPAAGGGPPAGLVVYAGFTGESTDIFAMNPDGTYATNLTSSRAFENAPDVSPDGSAIALERFGRAADSDIFVMAIDGSGLTRLTGDDAFEGSPAFSPDGSRIAFLREVRAGEHDLFVMDADGSDVRRLTRVGDVDLGGMSWHPDGNSIALARFDANFDTDLWSVDVTSGSLSRLLNAPNATQYSPRYSPDGSELAYIHFGNRQPSVRKIPAGGGTPAIVAGGPDVYVDSFAFAPDGGSLLASVLVGDGFAPEVRSYALDGSSYTLVTRERAAEVSWGTCGQGDCRLTEPAPTAVSVSEPVRAGERKVTVFASSAPLHVGAELTFTYYEQRADGTWRTVATKSATIEPSGFARASFRRLRRGRCRTVVSFPGDDDHLPARGRAAGRCRGVVAG